MVSSIFWIDLDGKIFTPFLHFFFFSDEVLLVMIYRFNLKSTGA